MLYNHFFLQTQVTVSFYCFTDDYRFIQASCPVPSNLEILVYSAIA